jgi:DinB superfamily
MTFKARSERLDPSEYNEYYGRYVMLVPVGDIVPILSEQIRHTLDFIGMLEINADQPYAPGKWNLKQVLGHLIDTERIFSYRALSFARGDASALPGMEPDDFQSNSGANKRSLEDLFMELTFLRQANVLMFEALPEEAWLRRGMASGYPVTVRALAHMIAGHELHHVKILQANLGLANDGETPDGYLT